MKTFLWVTFAVLTLGIGVLLYWAHKRYGSLSAAGKVLDAKIIELKTKLFKGADTTSTEQK